MNNENLSQSQNAVVSGSAEDLIEQVNQESESFYEGLDSRYESVTKEAKASYLNLSADEKQEKINEMTTEYGVQFTDDDVITILSIDATRRFFESEKDKILDEWNKAIDAGASSYDTLKYYSHFLAVETFSSNFEESLQEEPELDHETIVNSLLDDDDGTDTCEDIIMNNIIQK
jgi:hypothetical protein